MWSKEFWQDAGERALATFFQSFLAVVSVVALAAAVQTQDWSSAWDVAYVGLAAGGLAAVFSLAKSFIASYTGQKGTAQLGINTYGEK